MKIKKNKCNKKKVSQGGIKKRCNYDKDNLLRAINIVKHGESIAAASRRYNVPESTIRAHVKGKYSMKKTWVSYNSLGNGRKKPCEMDLPLPSKVVKCPSEYN